MDEKTEELRDIFMDVTDEETVTERQEETPGSLPDDDAVDQRLASVIAEMRADLEFGTSLSDEELVTVVRGFYAGQSDTEIARALGDASLSKTVARARTELHLLRETDRDAPFDFEAFRDALSEEASTAELAEAFEVSESTVRRYRRVVEAEREMRRVNDRYRTEFESLLEDRDLSERLTDSVQEDGLAEATEGQETDISL
ncbi:MAG: conditioned medium-induced protein 4 [Halobacteriaceae archaeon]